MSFKCDFCKKTAPNGTVCHTVPILFKEIQTPEGTLGTQIVREKRVCDTCHMSGVEILTATLSLPGAETGRFSVVRLDRE